MTLLSVTDLNVSEASSAQPAPSPREQSRQATRTRLLVSACKLFARHGLHKVTTHDIARDAGGAAGTFYPHFADKQELFREIVYELLEGLQTRLEQTTSNADDARTAQ